MNMKSIRLTEAMRTTILERLMDHAFKKQREGYRADLDALGNDVYRDVLPADIQRKMRALPTDFFELCAGMLVSFGGEVCDVSFSNERPLPQKYTGYHCAMVYAADHDFSKRRFALKASQQDLREREDKARSQAKAVIAGASTMKQLLEVWPECEPFVKDFLASKAPASVALSVPIDKLNAQLGLP